MTITLPVTKRDQSTSGKVLRAKGEVPAVVYGPKQPATAIAIEVKTLGKVLKEAGESTIITLTGLEAPTEVLLKEVDFDPVKQEYVHVDFYAVELGKEITTHVHLEFIGDAPAEDSGEVTVSKVLHELTVTCKPNVLPGHIDVDMTVLEKAGDKILVKDIKLPAGVTVDAEPDDVVVLVAAAKEEEEEAAETIDMDAIEVEAKGKTDEEES